MKPYIFLLISALSVMMMSLLRKEYDKRNPKSLLSSVSFVGIVYGIVFAVCMLVFLVSGTVGEFAFLDSFIVLDGLGVAFASVITTILCIVAASYGSVSLIVIFARLGNLVIAFVYGLAFDGNSADIYKWLGLAVAISIIVLNFILSDKGTDKSDLKKRRIYALLCLAVFFTNGSSIIFYRSFTKFRPDFPPLHFVSTYAFLSVLLAVTAFFAIKLFGKKEERAACLSFDRTSKIIVAVYACAVLCGEFLSLINTAILPIIIQAPVSFALPMIFITVGERVVYKTPITRPLLFKMALSLTCCILFE